LLGGSPLAKEKEVGAGAPTTDGNVLISEIRPNPQQPRTSFDEEGLEELRDSIRSHGVLQPIVVRQTAEGYELIAGERRLRASSLAGLKTIPVVIKNNVSDEALLELAMVENVQRRDLDALEKAAGYQKMMSELGLTQEQVAVKVGLKRATVANHVRLLDLPKEAQEALTAGLIAMGHARALLGLKSTDQIQTALGRIVRGGLSVRQTEEHVKAAIAPATPAGVSSELSEPVVPSEVADKIEESWVVDLQRQMQMNLATKVKLQNREGYKGKIVIEYYGREDLERLIKILAPTPDL
jgi:ParB family chromosome partitioning protein